MQNKCTNPTGKRCTGTRVINSICLSALPFSVWPEMARPAQSPKCPPSRHQKERARAPLLTHLGGISWKSHPEFLPTGPALQENGAGRGSSSAKGELLRHGQVGWGRRSHHPLSLRLCALGTLGPATCSCRCSNRTCPQKLEVWWRGCVDSVSSPSLLMSRWHAATTDLL